MMAWDVAKIRVKKDPVLFVSLILAVISMILVPPSEKYLDYIDIRTLAILVCLMAVVAGITATGAFGALAVRLLSGTKGITALSAVLVGLPFFLSMFITNDVSLITFVPFAIIVLNMAGRRDLIIPVTVLQTVAANLGSMLLPFGNPQNIFIASKYGAGIGDFVYTTGPYVILGALILALLILRIRGRCTDVSFGDSEPELDKVRLSVYLVLFIVCVTAVLRIMPYEIVFAIVMVAMIVLSPRTMLKIDWGLILTFVFLFVFTGNLASVDFIRDGLGDLLSWNTVITSAVVSQFISNVPATVMLSNFTADWSGLLAGVNIGGFGTPIASMASIITLRLYSMEKGADRIGFLKTFLSLNMVFLAILLLCAYALTYI